MAAHQAILYQRICRHSGCQAQFWICRHCDRGHCYCGPVCRRQARLQQRRCANRRYQQSVEAQLDHRDRQDAYRCRRRHRVTGHTSPAPASPALCGYAKPTTAPVTPAALAAAALFWHRQPRCIFCGATGRIVVAFPVVVRRR